MHDARELLERQRDALNAHDADALAECFHEELHSEDFVHPSHTFTGRDQVRRNWQLMFANVPDLQAELRGTAVDGDTVWGEWRIYGTRRDGRMLDLRGVVVSKVRDGRIVSSRRYLAPLESSDETVDDYFRRLAQPGPY
ncbi:MAG: nuclear transport factor 2 family protein [Thermoleophilia bacterium]|nr:nuclear transport factor 2 family protein [Thermoleophilia bacterium]